MVLFEKRDLESLKYQALVKLAKQNNVHRRYAPKAELVEKLLALNGDQCEKLSDVSAPSDMENDTELYSDFENSSPQQTMKVSDSAPKDCVVEGKETLSEISMSPRTPLVDKVNTRCSRSSFTVGSKPMTPQSTRRSLAGPAKVSHSKLHSQRLKCQNAGRERPVHNQPQIFSPRLTRQRTFEVENKTLFKSESPLRNLKRERTFEIKERDAVPPSKAQSPRLKRDGTYEVIDSSPSLKQETKSPASIQASKGSFVRQTSQGKVATRTSVRSSFSRSSVVASAEKVQVATNRHSNSRHFVTSRLKAPCSYPVITKSASKSKTPSVVKEIERKKAEVASHKIADVTGKKMKNIRKAPDFNTIHSRLFEKMESLIDSKQKVIDRANSMQKSQQKILQAASQRGPTNSKVVRKLISPKIGRSKITPKNEKFKFPSPKPIFQGLSSVFSSSVVAIQKRPSVGGVIPCVSKLQSPKRFVAASNNWSNNGSVVSRSGFNMAPVQSRMEIAKASVMKSVNLSSKTKQKEALKNVRLNKRFELQMRYRLSKQTS